ncbi:MAG: HDOD domain-containing protein [Desulfobacula sp.]|uniref:response regulator n=1 Tax=Desulfobacula sp. TaxID=2593537 RepID=UPI0025BA9060|nr:response regulator [Desulfobacula sp.]MCD4720245.1 HDOD domain-containing protein [Desulfobacula sp.]
MKKRILFVDDEPNILKGLQRSLRPLRKFWDMVFAEGGDNALKLLEKQSFDVIVTDMRMPGMDGAQLLKIVQDKYPMMVRIVLSGHFDREMIMKSVKSAHQYLSKPCEKQLLITTITRSCSLRDLLNKKALQQLLGGIGTMPSIPSLYARIMEELNSSDASVVSVGEIISEDIGMTAKVLQLVNSSFFGMPKHISNAKEAVILLGIDLVKTLVLGIEVFSKFSKSVLSIISVDKIHDHCVRTAVIVQKIAKLENMDKEKTDNAMIASMLHDLGKLILAEHFQDSYKDVIKMVQQKGIPVFKAEKEIFDVTHAEVGAYLLGLWGLPENIIEGIAFHHNPGKFIGQGFELCGLLHVAELLEHQERQQPGSSQKFNGLDEAYMERLGLLDHIPLWQDYLQRDYNE